MFALPLLSRLGRDEELRALASHAPVGTPVAALVDPLLKVGDWPNASRFLMAPAATLRDQFAAQNLGAWFVRAGNDTAAKAALTKAPSFSVRAAAETAIIQGRSDFARQLYALLTTTESTDSIFPNYYSAGFTLNPKTCPFSRNSPFSTSYLDDAFLHELRYGDPERALAACNALTDPAARIYASIGLARAALEDPSPGYVLAANFNLGARDLLLELPAAADFDIELDKGNLILASRSLPAERLAGKPLLLNGRNWYPIWKSAGNGARTVPFFLSAARVGWSLHAVTAEPLQPTLPPPPVTASPSLRNNVYSLHLTLAQPSKSSSLKVHLFNTLRDPALRPASPTTQPN